MKISDVLFIFCIGLFVSCVKEPETVQVKCLTEEAAEIAYKIRSITTQSHGPKSSDFFGV